MTSSSSEAAAGGTCRTCRRGCVSGALRVGWRDGVGSGFRSDVGVGLRDARDLHGVGWHGGGTKWVCNTRPMDRFPVTMCTSMAMAGTSQLLGALTCSLHDCWVLLTAGRPAGQRLAGSGGIMRRHAWYGRFPMCSSCGSARLSHVCVFPS